MYCNHSVINKFQGCLGDVEKLKELKTLDKFGFLAPTLYLCDFCYDMALTFIDSSQIVETKDKVQVAKRTYSETETSKYKSENLLRYITQKKRAFDRYELAKVFAVSPESISNYFSMLQGKYFTKRIPVKTKGVTVVKTYYAVDQVYFDDLVKKKASAKRKFTRRELLILDVVKHNSGFSYDLFKIAITHIKNLRLAYMNTILDTLAKENYIKCTKKYRKGLLRNYYEYLQVKDVA